MKQMLNPNLVRKWFYQDLEQLQVPCVILRDPENHGPDKEVSIGPIEVDLIQEKKGEVAQFSKYLRKDAEALEEAMGRSPIEDPHILLAKSCFDFEGPVRVLIYSKPPFAEDGKKANRQ